MSNIEDSETPIATGLMQIHELIEDVMRLESVELASIKAELAAERQKLDTLLNAIDGARP